VRGRIAPRGQPVMREPATGLSSAEFLGRALAAVA
jgi:hypothetical protein